MKMNKLEEVEALAEELECDYDVAFHLVYYMPGDPYDTSTDDAL